MNLYIKQKIFSVGDEFSIFDKDEYPIYIVFGDFFTMGSHVHLTDLNRNELLSIEQKMEEFIPVYEITINNIPFGTLLAKKNLFFQKITLKNSSENIVIKGNYKEYDYSIYSNDELLGTVTHEYLVWGATYCLSVQNEENVKMFLAIVLGISSML